MASCITIGSAWSAASSAMTGTEPADAAISIAVTIAKSFIFRNLMYASQIYGLHSAESIIVAYRINISGIFVGCNSLVIFWSHG
jgi:hypothetical protein